MSPTETCKETKQKIDEYLAIGVEWVWVVDPGKQTLMIYRLNEEVEILRETDTLTGEGLLDGFKLRIAKILKNKLG